jgi:lipopolysaccharide transport system ATP-binding protein
MEPIIRVENLSKQYKLGGVRKSFPTFREILIENLKNPLKFLSRNSRANDNVFWALKDVSFDVFPSERIGIIGRNGAGKSTLLKILSRITKQTSGRVELYGRIGSLLEVGTGFHPELSGRENVFLNGAILGMKRAEIIAKFDEIVDFAEIERFLDTPVKRYSSGMYMRLAFAVAAFLEPDILVIDEVLAVGDARFQKKCLGKMDDITHEGRTIIFVSHDMSLMRQLCSRVLILTKGKLDYSGDTQSAIDRYLRSESKSSETTFEGEVLRWARVRQIGEQIEISAQFEWADGLDFPSLGFVIYDSIGNPVIGRNLKADAGQVSLENYNQKAGFITVIIEWPKLSDGKYGVSLWFGDGTNDDIFYAPFCLFFEVSEMSIKKQLPVSINGSAVPECRWTVESRK